MSRREMIVAVVCGFVMAGTITLCCVFAITHSRVQKTSGVVTISNPLVESGSDSINADADTVNSREGSETQKEGIVSEKKVVMVTVANKRQRQEQLKKEIAEATAKSR